VRINVKLPIAILDIIHTHGKVVDSSYFSKVETVTTLAGSIRGNKEGTGSNALFAGPVGMCLNPFDDCLYVCDSYNESIRKISKQGEVSNFVSKNYLLKNPQEIVRNNKENCYYVIDQSENTILKITSSGKVKFAV